MNIGKVVVQNVGKKVSTPALFVLGMHRSGTSAITGTLRLCGAWVGEKEELTGENVENPRGFWERQDVRKICDQLLHSAGADWWKISNFDQKAIPEEVLSEKAQEFEKIVSSLNKYETWVIKEPRLCLLLPVLRRCVKSPVCIHVYRNPLDVARSLQARNGFSISAGLALWEAYNLHALNASKDLPRILVSCESLMLHPVETLNALVDGLEELVSDHSIKPNRVLIEEFIDSSLYHQRAIDEDIENHLSPPQNALWLHFRGDNVLHDSTLATMSVATRQSLRDFELTEDSLNTYKHELRELSAALEKRDARIITLEERSARLGTTLEKRDAALEKRDARIITLEERSARLGTTLEKRDAALEKRDARIITLEERSARLGTTLEKRDAALEKRDARIITLEERSARLGTTLEKRDAALEKRDARIITLEERSARLGTTLEKRDAALEKRDARIITLEERSARLGTTLEKRDAALEKRDARIITLEERSARLGTTLEKRDAALEKRDARIITLEDEINSIYNSFSWKITTPLRAVSWGLIWLQERFCHAIQPLLRLSTNLISLAVSSIYPHYRQYVPRYIHELIPEKLISFFVRYRIPPGNQPSIGHHAGKTRRDPEETGYQDQHLGGTVRPTTRDSTRVAVPPPQISTYIIPVGWWERYPDAARSIVQSGQAVIVVGAKHVGTTGASVTTITGQHVEALALATVTTKTAIKIGEDADPAATVWSKWIKAVENGEIRQDGAVQLLMADAMMYELSSDDIKGVL